MIYKNANEARIKLYELREKLFTPIIIKAINQEREKNLAECRDEKVEINGYIKDFTSVQNKSLDEISTYLSVHSPKILSHIYDRFLSADRYLRSIKSKQVLVEEQDADFLRQCLIDFS